MTVNRIVSVACVLGACTVGFLIGDNGGEIELQAAQLQAAVLRAEQGRKAYDKLVAAQDALDAARRDAVRLDGELERMRLAESQRAKRASADACRVERTAIARCEKLLNESAELLVEGSQLLQRGSGIHDALVRTLRQ